MTISTATAVGAPQASQSSNIGIEDFLKILTSQLNNQDPLKPVDNQEFVAQIAQFATLEQSRQLNAKIDSLLSVQSSTQSIGLLGRSVDFSQNGQTMSGKVTGLSLASGQPLLSITPTSGGVANDVSLSQLINIR
jgi:flagellar basal-body rod modification protein FlgD